MGQVMAGLRLGRLDLVLHDLLDIFNILRLVANEWRTAGSSTGDQQRSASTAAAGRGLHGHIKDIATRLPLSKEVYSCNASNDRSSSEEIGARLGALGRIGGAHAWKAGKISDQPGASIE